MLRVALVCAAFASTMMIACGPGTPGEDKADSGEVPPQQACTEDSDCTDMVCCGVDDDNGHCADTSWNRFDCGGCGDTCAEDGEACLDGACREVVFAALCEGGEVIRVSDGLANDDQAGGTMATAVSEACGGGAASLNQDDPSLIDGNGNMLPGKGEILVVTGGVFVSTIALALESYGTTGVYFTGNETGGGFYDMETGATVASWDAADISSTHDFFAVQISPDPLGSRVVITAAGADQAGTKAAARWFESVVAPDLRGHSKRSYVVEWTDSDEDGTPSAGDTYDEVGSR